MPDENPTPTAVERENTTDTTLLLVLLNQPACGPWTVEEIERELEQNPTDGLRRLYGAGLAHREGRYVWATRTAVRASELDF